MTNPELNRKTETEIEDSSSLKGTFVSVMILGVILIVTWAGVFAIFLDRS